MNLWNESPSSGMAASELALMASRAAAQNAGQEQTVLPDPAGLADVVVTARPSQESLQSVPVAASAFNPEAIEAHGIRYIKDFAQVVPNLHICSSKPRTYGVDLRRCF